VRKRHGRRIIPWSTLAGFDPSDCGTTIPSREADEYATATREMVDGFDIVWDWFITLTYAPGRVSFEKASRDFLRWARKVERAALSAREARRLGIRWVRAIERHKDGTPHIHALLADCPDMTQKQLRELWPHGTINEVKPFDPDRESVRYLLKDIGRGAQFALSPTFKKRTV